MHYKSPPFHTVIRIQLISLSYHILVYLPSHFSSMEQMLMLLLMQIKWTSYIVGYVNDSNTIGCLTVRQHRKVNLCQLRRKETSPVG